MVTEERLEAFDIGRPHVEERRQRFVTSTRSLESAPDDSLEVLSSEVTRHERMLNGRPERLAVEDHAIEHAIGRRHAFPARCCARANLRGQVFSRDDPLW